MIGAILDIQPAGIDKSKLVDWLAGSPNHDRPLQANHLKIYIMQ